MFADGEVNPAEVFARNQGARDRFLKLTRSAAHLYSAVAASALDRHGFEKVLGHSFGEMGELIVVAIDVLEYTARARPADE